MVCRCIFPLFTFVPVVYRMDEFALIGTSSESTSKSVSLDGARRMALKRIEAFVLTFSDPQTFAAAAASSAPASLSQVTESARIPEAGHLRCRFSLSLSCWYQKLYLYLFAPINVNFAYILHLERLDISQITPCCLSIVIHFDAPNCSSFLKSHQSVFYLFMVFPFWHSLFKWIDDPNLNWKKLLESWRSLNAIIVLPLII